MVDGCCGKKLEAYGTHAGDHPAIFVPQSYRAMLITKGEIDALYIPGACCGDGFPTQVFICDSCARKLGFLW